MPLPPQPLEFSDFSGGITENYLQGEPHRYQYADNFLIGNAKELEERWGIVAYSAGAYSVGATRVNGFFNFINESVLMPACGRDIFVQYAGQDYWTRIQGMDGNQALQGGDNQSQIGFSEFQRQVYFTSDGDDDNARGILPSKIFRDETNTWVARTVGLPRAYVSPNYTADSLLNKCIEVANALRTSMISHMGDALNTTVYSAFTTPFTSSNIYLHTYPDKYSLSYLSTQTFAATDPETPSPVPTAAPAATNLATLLTLVQALNLAYAHHVADSTRGSLQNSSVPAAAWGFGPAYHFYGLNLPATGGNVVVGPAAVLSNNALPDDVEEAATMLDDLFQKWNWHRKAVNTHSPNNDPLQFIRYTPNVTKIGTVYLEKTTPTVTPDFTDIINYANNLRFLHNQHVTNAYYSFVLGAHKKVDFVNQVLLPEAQTIDDAYLLFYWLRALYYSHYIDGAPLPSLDTTANFATNVTFTGASTAALTVVVRTDTGGPSAMSGYLEVALGVEPKFNQYDGGGSYRVAKILSSTSGTATLDRKTTSSGTLRAGQFTNSQFHSSYDSTGTLVTAYQSPELTTSALSNPAYTIGTDLDTWLDLANEYFFAWQSHVTNSLLHASGSIGAYQYYFLGSPNNGLAGVPYPNFIIPTAAQYSYAFMWTHTYTVEPNGIEYLVQSNPVFSDSITAAKSWPVDSVPPGQEVYLTNDSDIYGRLILLPFAVRNTYGNLITGLPVISNNNSTNYDVANLKLQIYRTTDGGNTYYLLKEVTNGTTSFLDTVNDTVGNPGDTPLTPGREPIYTSGGVQGHDQPPVCKYIHVLQGVTYYGAITDSDQYFPQRIIQSPALTPDAAPLGNLLDLDDELTGLTSTRSNLLAMCKSSIVRVSGGFNTLGQGSLIGEKISDAMGCLNSKSIVRTEVGVFYAGTDGFYYTDGFQVIKISLDLDKTYAALTASFNQQRSIYGGYDKLTRRVYWLMKQHEDDSDNSVAYIFHINYGIKPSGAFTTFSNGLNFKPSSLVFKDGIAYFGHELGAILKTDPNQKWDHNVVQGSAPSLWTRIHIPYLYRSTAVDMGTIFNRKWLTKMHLVGENHGNVLLQPYALRDLNQTQAGAIAMAEVNYNVNPRWGDARCIWGDVTTKWEYDGKMDVWRRFPATTLRSDFMQVEIRPANACIYSSSNDFPEFSTAQTDAATKIVSIATPAGYASITWPKDVVGYRIKFAVDDYTTEYTISAFGATEASIVVLDPSGTLQTVTGAGMAWEIWGYKKEQRLNITSFVLHFALLGQTNQAYPGSKSTSGAGNAGRNT